MSLGLDCMIYIYIYIRDVYSERLGVYKQNHP